jgi:CSLREA domain-containing protein
MKHFRLLDRSLRLLSVAALAAGLALSAGPAPAAHAANFTVNSTADAVDASPGDGECATAGGVCTLRAAIQEANALAGPDTITLPAGAYAIAITGVSEEFAATGDFDISDDLTINGAGAATTIIDGAGLDRVFDIDGISITPPTSAYTPTVSINGVTIQNGVATSLGGGIVVDGAVFTLTNSAVISNAAALDDEGGGLAILINTDLGYPVTSTVSISNSAILSNTVPGSPTGGGGISSAGILTVTNSTISGNVSGTPSVFGDGGGIRNIGQLTLVNTTITANDAGSGGNLYNNGASGSTTLKNTIIANPVSGNNCSIAPPWTSLGYNLSSDASCSLTGTGDRPNTNPNLGPLQNNGGTTLTHALLTPSLAINGGNPAGCTDASGNPLTTDQRGFARPQGFCDIGAFESNATPTISSITGQSTNEDTATSAIAFTVGDGAETPAADLSLTGSSSNQTLVPNGNIAFGGSGASRTVTVTPAANQFGTATITVTVTDGGGASATSAFLLTVNAVADTPSVTDAATNEDAQTSTGLVLSRNAADGGEVTHFKITGITNGTLYKSDGATAISNGAFITFAEGNAGLKFTPSTNFFGTASFTAQASTSASDGGLGGSTVTANITVNAVADTPSVTDAATNEDAQTSTGLVLSRNAADGGEVTHFKITGITNGTLYKSDGATAISNGAFITFAEGNAGLKFTPSTNFFGTASFTAQASTSASDGGLGGSTVTANITVTPVNDAPTISTIPNQSGGSGLPVGPIAFTVADVDTAVDSLGVSGSSSNTALIPNANIVFGGSGANRTVTVKSLTGVVGTVTITITVNDGAGGITTTAFDVTLSNMLYLPLVVRAP